MRIVRILFPLAIFAVLSTGCAGGRHYERFPTDGPAIESAIVGYTTWKTARVALRTEEPGIAQVTLVSKVESFAQRRTLETTAEGGNLAVIDIDSLLPRQRYDLYDLRGKIGSIRTMPEAGDRVPMRFAVGSCFNFEQDEVTEFAGGNKRRIENHRVWRALNKEKNLDAFFMIGDRFYLPNKYDAFDNLGESGARDLFLQHHLGMLSVPGVAERFSTVPVYCIWDDHDFGPNDSGTNFRFRDIALEFLDRSFGNPPMGEPGNPGGYFRASFGAVDAFFLDDRYHRDCPGGAADDCSPEKRQLPDGTYTAKPPLDTMLGRRQFQWLKEGLASSKAPLKLVINGGQMLSNIHPYEHWGLFQEREAFLDWLDEEKVPGIVFIAGDRHHGEIGVIRSGVPYPLYELTSSGLGVNTYGADEGTPGSPYEVIGPVADVQHYGLIEYDPRSGGSVTLRLVSREGKEINSVEIPLTELQPH